MNDASYGSIFLNAALVNNFVLAYFLGLCPFFGVSSKLETAVRMGGAVSFVMLVASVCAFLMNLLLDAVNAPYLKLISYILVISSTVQLVEMLMRKLSPATFRAMGIFLPLITTNCAILGLALFQTNRAYSFTQAVVFALGAGVGFALALVLMAGVREKLNLGNVPESGQGHRRGFDRRRHPVHGLHGFRGFGPMNLILQLLIATALLALMMLLRMFANRRANQQKLSCASGSHRCSEIKRAHGCGEHNIEEE